MSDLYLIHSSLLSARRASCLWVGCRNQAEWEERETAQGKFPINLRDHYLLLEREWTGFGSQQELNPCYRFSPSRLRSRKLPWITPLSSGEKLKWVPGKQGDGRGKSAPLKYLCCKLACVLSLWFFKYLSSVNILKTALKFATGALFIRSVQQPQTAAPAKSVTCPCRDSSWRMVPGLWERAFCSYFQSREPKMNSLPMSTSAVWLQMFNSAEHAPGFWPIWLQAKII